MTFSKRLLFLFFLSAASLGFSQTIESPSPGKSLVYFTRTSGAGALINFKYFDGDKYLGKFAGVNYIVYECEPGDHVFWSASENRDFVQAELLPDKTYIIEVVPRMGAIKAGVNLFPVSPTDVKRLKRVNKLLTRKDPRILNEGSVKAEATQLAFFIENGIKKYNEKVEKEKEILKLISTWSHN